MQPGPSFGTFVRIFFPQENQMLIMNDNINARAPLLTRANTDYPFRTHLFGISVTHGKTIGSFEVNMRGKSKIYRIYGSIILDVCKDFASRWPTFTYTWIFENRVSKKIQLILLLVHTNPGGGALGYFLGGYVPPGTPNWHPILEKISPKIDTPF